MVRLDGKAGGITRRIGVALVAALAVATAASEGDSQAQSLDLQLGGTTVQAPSVTLSPQQIAVPQVTVEAPSVTVTTPSVTVTPPPAPPPPVRVTPPTVRVDPPAVPVKPPALPVTPPSVKPAPVKPPTGGGGTPSLPVKPPSLPVDPTGGSGSSTPRLPSIPDVDGPSADGTAGGGGGVTLRSLLGRADAPAGAVGGSTGGGSGAGGSSAAAAIPLAALTQAAPGIARVPSPAELAKLPPAQRREIVRQIWDTPLRKQRLRQLRTAIAEYQGCLDMLSTRGQRTLLMRAGVGRAPATRRVVARRLGTSLRGAVRIERSALRRLVGAGERGLCGGGGSGGAGGVLGDGQGASGDAAGTSADSAGGDRDGVTPIGDVLADVHEGGPGVDLGDGEEGSTETLLFFLLALLGPLAAIALASRRRAANGAAAAADERPVLFLDVDGVIALSPFSSALPPGRVQQLALGSTHVSDRTGELLRELATRFELVWATGWEHHANSSLLSPLGLEEELPTLTFGKKARHGSSKWKIKSVDEYAGDRPAAWLDDNFVARHERWAAHRSAPTLLVRVDSRVGLAPEHVDRLMRWADRVAPAARVRSNGNGSSGSPNGARRSRSRVR